MIDNFCDYIKSFSDYVGASGCTDKEIVEGEKLLNLRFAQEYKQYLKEIGLACFAGHELTGLTSIERLSVIAVTLQERAYHPEVPETWYVVEQTNISGIVVWQDVTGDIYITSPCGTSRKINDSLLEYISTSI